MGQLFGVGLALLGLLFFAVLWAAVRNTLEDIKAAAKPKALIAQTRVRLLEENPELAPAKGGSEGSLEREGLALRFVVDGRARTLVQIDVCATGARDFTEQELTLGVPRFVSGYALVWVNGDRPLADLEWVLDLAHAYAGTGSWGALAAQHDLVWGRGAEGYPELKGPVAGRACLLRQEGPSGLYLELALPPGLYARPGTGVSGDPMMDLLVESSGIPVGAREAVLALVHGRGAHIEGGRLQLSHPGSLGALWPELWALVEALEGAATPED